MTLAKTDLGLFLTGGAANADPNLSLGGNVSSVELLDNITHNLFRRITDSEASSGITLYRCLAIKNRSAVDTMRSVSFYMVSDTLSVDDFALYSKAQAAKNNTETTIADEFTAPTGSNINFIAALSRSGGLQLGDLAPSEFINIWLKIIVNPGAVQFPNNSYKIRVESGSQDSSNPPTPPPDPDTGTNFSMAAIADMAAGSRFQTNWNRITARNTSFVLFPGDLCYCDGGGGWLDIVKSYKDKSLISIGNHDGDESESQPSTKNAYLNAYPILAGKTYGKKIFNNVGIVTMESGENQTVSDAVGSDQYNFVKAALEEFKANAAIEWIFVMNHYPFYGPSSNHSNNTGGRDRYDPLFDANGVDVVFTAHNHNIWHSKLLAYNSGSPSNPTATGTDPDYSYSKASTNHGKLYIDVAAGGKSLYSISSVPSYVVFSNDSTYGYCFMEFTNNGKKITFKFYNSSDTLLKTWSLTHT